METILDRIIHEKQKEVIKLREGNLIKVEAKPKRSFIQKLQTSRRNSQSFQNLNVPRHLKE